MLKTKSTHIFSLFLTVFIIVSCSKKDDDISLDAKADDIKIVKIIEPQFKYVSIFSDGVAAVCIGGKDCKWGYVDRAGKILINPKFETAGHFESGFAFVKKDGNKTLAILNKKGESLVLDFGEKNINKLYEDLTDDSDISEGLVSVTKLENGIQVLGFIDTKGQLKIDSKFTDVEKFYEGLAAAKDDRKSDKWGFIDKNGKFKIEPQFENVGEFHEGLASFRIGKYEEGDSGFIDKSGKIVINPKFKAVKSFSEGLAAAQIIVEEKRKWGFIDKKGNFVIGPIYDFDTSNFDEFLSRAMSFSNGLASVKVFENNTEKWGYINKKGQFIISPQFSRARRFSEGLAAVKIGVGKSAKWGFIDSSGKFIVNPIYDEVEDFHEGIAAIRQGDDEHGLWGFIEKQ